MEAKGGAAEDGRAPSASAIDAEAAPTAAVLPVTAPAPIAPPEAMVVSIVLAVSFCH